MKETPYYHKEVTSIIPGEAGEPLSYSIRNDGFVALALIVCILISIIMTARSSRFIAYQTKNIFRTPRENSIELRETVDEMQYQIFFCIQGIVMMAAFAYSFTRTYIGGDLPIDDYLLIGIYCIIFVAYRVIGELIRSVAHGVFFNKTERHLSNVSQLFLIALQGAAMLPLLLLHIYCKLDNEITLYALAAIVITTLLLRFYKAFCIFFRKKHSFLQFFLYLCTLEAVPLALLTGILITIANYLKINF